MTNDSPAPPPPPSASGVDRVIRQYVVQYMTSRLERMPGEAGDAEIAMPSTPGKGEVFIVSYPSGRKTVLRAFDDPAKFKRYFAAMRYCAQYCAQYSADKALPLPRMIHGDGSRAAWGLFRHYFLEEEFVDGTPLQVGEAETGGPEPGSAETVIRALAQLHSATAHHWGKFGHWKKGSYTQSVEGSINKLFQQLGTYSERPAWGELGLWHGWFGMQLEKLAEPECFSLIHENLAPENILIAADGESAIFTGNGRLRFGCFVWDLERALAFLAPQNPQQRESLLNHYLQTQTHMAPPEDYGRQFALYRAAFHLRRYRSALKRRAKGREVPEEKMAAVLKDIRSCIW